MLLNSTRPPAEVLKLNERALPQPHLEMLQGLQGPTLSPAARTQSTITILRYGPGPPLHNFLAHKMLRPLVNTPELPALCVPPPPALSLHIGTAASWFSPAWTDLPDSQRPSVSHSPTALPLPLQEHLSVLQKFPRRLAARVIPPYFNDLLHYLHIPATDTPKLKQLLYRTWAKDCVALQKAYCMVLGRYAHRHNIPLTANARKCMQAGQNFAPPPAPLSAGSPIELPYGVFASHPIAMAGLTAVPSTQHKKLQKLKQHLRDLHFSLTDPTRSEGSCGGLCMETDHSKCKLSPGTTVCMKTCNHVHGHGATTACEICGNCRPSQKQPRRTDTNQAQKFMALAKLCHCTCEDFMERRRSPPPIHTPGELVQLSIADMFAAAPNSAESPASPQPQAATLPLSSAASAPLAVASLVGRQVRHCHFSSASDEGQWLTGRITKIESLPSTSVTHVFHIDYEDQVPRAPLTFAVVKRALLPEDDHSPVTQPPLSVPRRGMPTPSTLVGRKVAKHFYAETDEEELALFQGTVTQVFHPTERAPGTWGFHVQYTDGDSETMEWTELRRILVPQRRQTRGTTSNAPKSRSGPQSVPDTRPAEPLPPPISFPSAQPRAPKNSTQLLLTACLSQEKPSLVTQTPQLLPPAHRLQGSLALWAPSEAQPVTTPNPNMPLDQIQWHFPFTPWQFN